MLTAPDKNGSEVQLPEQLQLLHFGSSFDRSMEQVQFWVLTFKGPNGVHVGPHLFGLCWIAIWAMLGNLEPIFDQRQCQIMSNCPNTGRTCAQNGQKIANKVQDEPKCNLQRPKGFKAGLQTAHPRMSAFVGYIACRREHVGNKGSRFAVYWEPTPPRWRQDGLRWLHMDQT